MDLKRHREHPELQKRESIDRNDLQRILAEVESEPKPAAAYRGKILAVADRNLAG